MLLAIKELTTVHRRRKLLFVNMASARIFIQKAKMMRYVYATTDIWDITVQMMSMSVNVAFAATVSHARMVLEITVAGVSRDTRARIARKK